MFCNNIKIDNVVLHFKNPTILTQWEDLNQRIYDFSKLREKKLMMTGLPETCRSTWLICN
jgi:hypothetical protein